MGEIWWTGRSLSRPTNMKPLLFGLPQHLDSWTLTPFCCAKNASLSASGSTGWHERPGRKCWAASGFSGRSNPRWWLRPHSWVAETSRIGKHPKSSSARPAWTRIPILGAGRTTAFPPQKVDKLLSKTKNINMIFKSGTHQQILKSIHVDTFWYHILNEDWWWLVQIQESENYMGNDGSWELNHRLERSTGRPWKGPIFYPFHHARKVRGSQETSDCLSVTSRECKTFTSIQIIDLIIKCLLDNWISKRSFFSLANWGDV